jgi:Uma2 family endonuclease
MTAAMSDLPPARSDLPPDGGWTTGDLDAMPDDGIRRELLDGVLLESPSPTNIHQKIAGRLMVALEESCPTEFDVTQGVEIRISDHRSFIPDVIVTTYEAARRGGGLYQPHEVVLAIEIVSPTSQSMDRIAKPALYAAAGIPYYWRIETDSGLSVHAHKIDAENKVYRPVGIFDAEIAIDEPWPITVPIKKLTPRYL